MSSSSAHSQTQSILLSTSKDFHNVLVKYTDFIIRDIAEHFKLNYTELNEKYIVRSFRAPASRRSVMVSTSRPVLVNN